MGRFTDPIPSKAACDIHKDTRVPLGTICPKCYIAAHKKIARLQEELKETEAKINQLEYIQGKLREQIEEKDATIEKLERGLE